MNARVAAALLTAVLGLLAVSPALAAAPATSGQALKLIEALVAKQKSACKLTWKHMTAQGLTMEGPPWRVTVTGVSTSKGSGSAIWTITGIVNPSNKLATAISSGCR